MLLIPIKIILLDGLIRLLYETESPFLCAGIYAFARAVFALLFGNPVESIIIGTLIAGALAALYFWALDKTMGTGFIFWIIAVAGVVIGLV